MHAHARQAARIGAGLAVIVAAMLATPGTASADPARGNATEAQAEHKKPDAAKGPAPDTAKGAAKAPSGAAPEAPPAPDPPTQPQPLSKADGNGSGANQRGPYDSTREGSPSHNGDGDGEAKGRPCAGCVGKADNKNPPGQRPGPQDRNNGHECDGNHGIGKGNPAHTGCAPDEDPPDEDPPPGADPPDEDPPPGAEPLDGDPPPGEGPVDGDPPPGEGPVGEEPVDTGVGEVFIPIADVTELPQTGASGVVPLGAAGLGLLLAGAAFRTVGLVRRGRTDSAG